ncbi:carbohydrate-binding protein [Streptomyces kebangsaanensis]|uniref:carbohydrate-binding protein n=1 Tax=Streptomyces kebangsaanensis TaxID=864058 RepID=UPI00093F0763|nr:carbohydrate-binding protein [Streptomyces kebangsaanensis]
MTAGNNGASTPEDDDPFGYLYADGQANGAQPPSGGYGYPNAVNRVHTVGQRQYGQQPPAAPHGQVPQQQGAYGRPNAHYAAPETHPGGAPTGRQPGQGGGRGPNTKGLLIGAVAVVAAVVIGISVAMLNGDSDDKGENKAGGPTPTATQSSEPSPSTSADAESPQELPTIDAKALRLEGNAATASDVKGAKAAGGVYVTNFNNVGASVTWTVNGIPEGGKYSLYVGYGVPGKDGTATLTVNGTASDRPVNLKNWAGAPEGDYEKGWTETYNFIQLNKGTNIIKVSCEEGNQCDANLDRLWLVKGWVGS